MQKPVAILATALVLPTIAGIAWMLAPSPQALLEDAPRGQIPDAVSPAASSQASGTTATAATISKPGITRPSDDHFPETTPALSPALAGQLPAAPAPSVSPRYTLTTQPDAATLAARLQDQLPLQRDERIRVLPVDAASEQNQTAATAASVVLIVDAALHDPAAWIEDAKPGNPTQTDVKAKIADEFSAEVAAAVKQPETADKNLEGTWQSARAKANWEYQKFFGSEAANRAGMAAGRSAVAK
jgi:hypothetical protein